MKNQNSLENGIKFPVANLEDEMFMESLQLQAELEDIEDEMFMESLQLQAELEDIEDEMFMESL